MKKLWKTTVNNYGWNNPRTLYAETRQDAERLLNRYPAGDPVKYAGCYSDSKAAELLDYSNDNY